MTWPYEVRRDGALLEQVDGAVYFEGLACLTEARDWRVPLGFMSVAQMKMRLLRRPKMTLGAVFNNGTFTGATVGTSRAGPRAISFARPLPSRWSPAPSP